MTSNPPSLPPKLHELNPTARFSDRADDYAKFRPSYPAAAIDAIVALVKGKSEPWCADIGAGTGISSRLIADRGVRVTAVEPNAAMRAAAEAHPLIEWHDGSAEATRLAPCWFDLVLCAQAFHWFNADAALAEFHRILLSRGSLCLMWNDRDNTDPFTAEYSRLILQASGDHPAARDRSECGQVIFGSSLFENAGVQIFPYDQPMTLDGLIGRALSASYVPKIGERHDALVKGLKHAFERHAPPGGIAHMKYRTRVYSATSRD